MKIISSVFLLAFILLAACSSPRDWSFIQSVGGISIGKPYLEKHRYHLPVKVDVSGLQKITIKPTILNSALMCSRIAYSVSKDKIFISIYTSLIDESAPDNCKSISLPRIAPGKYTVYYGLTQNSKHVLGKITISATK